MSFVDNLSVLQEQILKFKHQVSNKEAAKLALAIPFIESLGFNVRDPYEVIPGFSLEDKCKEAGEIDFCTMVNNSPAFMIACQSPNTPLDISQSALIRCFADIPTKFAILTNGIQYQFFTDLEVDDVLDTFPFLDIDLENLSDADREDLSRFQKSTFNPKEILVAVTAVKFRKDLKEALYQELVNPSEEFIFHILKSIKIGRVTQKLIEAYRPDVKECIRETLEELVDDMISPSSTSPLPHTIQHEVTASLPESLHETLRSETVSEHYAQYVMEEKAESLNSPVSKVEVFTPPTENGANGFHPADDDEQPFSIRY